MSRAVASPDGHGPTQGSGIAGRGSGWVGHDAQTSAKWNLLGLAASVDRELDDKRVRRPGAQRLSLDEYHHTQWFLISYDGTCR